MENNTIEKGWLIKSPPEKKTKGPWKFLRAKWHRRYFVLYAPHAADSLPGTRVALDYFENEKLNKKYGDIDLNHCDEVQCKLDSAFYQHVFSIRTKHKGRDRTYYLAADSERDMTKWVDCLCLALGLKENDEPAPRETAAPVAPAGGVSTSNFYNSRPDTLSTSPPSMAPNHHSPQPPQRHPSPGISVRSVLADSPSPNHAGRDAGEYLHLEKCTTGSRMSGPRNSNGSEMLEVVPPPPSSHSSNFSIPTEQAPEPPLRQMPHTNHNTSHITSSPNYTNLNHDSTYQSPRSIAQSVYNVPRQYQTDSSYDPNGLYDVPPASQLVGHRHDVDSVYQYPPAVPREVGRLPVSHSSMYNVLPAPRPHLPPHTDLLLASGELVRKSNSSSESHSSHGVAALDSGIGCSDSGGSQELYDHPKYSHRHTSSTLASNTSTLTRITTDDTYDYPGPRKSVSENNLLGKVVPCPVNPADPALGLGQDVEYINVPPTPRAQSDLRNTLRSQPIDEPEYDIPPSHSAIADLAKLSLSPPPPPPCNASAKVHSYINAQSGVLPNAGDSYVPMINSAMENLHQTYADMGHLSGIYSVPPSGRPVPSDCLHDSPPPPPARAFKSLHSDGSSESNREFPPIHTTVRTRSFKRHIVSPSSDVLLPVKKDGYCTSDEDTEDSQSISEPSLDVGLARFTLPNRQLPPKAVQLDMALPPTMKTPLNCTPPPPRQKHSGEVKYLDLDLERNDDTSEPERSPGFGRSPSHGNSSPTDYKEIDFVKTRALSDMKQARENKRRSSHKSIDE